MTTQTQQLTAPLRATARNATSANQAAYLLRRWLQWRPVARLDRQTLSVAELAECTCPDLCNRDHSNE
jgi:hypothetical protein